MEKHPLILIHGSWHGAWSWDKVLPLLRSAGHSVTALDLPGHGADSTPLAQITIDDYLRAMKSAMDVQHEPPILVGHSMGGISLSLIAEKHPREVKALVYVAGLMLGDGQTYRSVGEHNSKSLLAPYRVELEPGVSYGLAAEGVKPCLLGCGSDDDVKFVQERLSAQPTTIGKTTVRISDERFGSVPRYYVKCLQDRCLDLSFQEWMIAQTPCDGTFEIDTDHSPQTSRPQELATVLEHIANGVR